MSNSSELLATMAVIAAGAMLGRVQFRGLRLDVAAMLLVGVGVAHFGVTVSPSLGLFGLLLFLYTVGVRAGPALRSMKRDELKLPAVGLGMLVILLIGTVTVGLAMGLPAQVTLGSFTGFFGSGAALALLEARGQGGGASAGFAVAAPLSSLLVMVLVQAWHKSARRGIDQEIQAWNQAMAGSTDRVASAQVQVLGDEAIDKTLLELRLPCQVLWVQRGAKSFAPHASTKLQREDLLLVSGPQEGVDQAVERLGRIVPSRARGPQEPVVVKKFLVSDPQAIGVRLDRFLFRERYGATITRVRRAGMDLRPRPGFTFRWGDRVQVSLPPEHVDDLRRLFGDDAHGLEEFAFPRAAVVIFIGGLLGAAPIHLSNGDSLRLGPAFGVIVTSIAASALHRTGPMVWSQSGPTLRLMSHIGLPLFIAQVGNASYAGLIGAWNDYGVLLVSLSFVPVILLIGLATVVGRVFGYGALTVLSLVPSVAMNTPALTTLQDQYRERIPGHVYAAVYPIVMLGLLAVVFALSLVL